VLGDGETWDRVERIEVKDRTDSDHFPLEVWLRGEVKERGRKVNGRRGRWRWTKKGRDSKKRWRSGGKMRRVIGRGDGRK